MAGDDEVLLEIADSVADGRSVDWERIARASPNLSGKLRWLRMMEAVSAAHCQEASLDTQSLPIASAGPHLDLPFEWGPLILEERLGGGSRGTVYSARDTRLGCDVALKLLRSERAGPADADRFLDEAQRLARVRHPNVLVVYGADRHAGRVGLWTELLAGRTLEECLQANGPFAAEEAARIGIDLCRALAAVHGAGLVHRDVKTANVMREGTSSRPERGGRIVLLDFSSVAERAMGDGPSADQRLSGTPLFMAPELFHSAEADARSDIYSLGVLLYRLVTASYPVEASSLDDLAARHARGERRSLLDARADLPPPFVHVVERALERDPALRWASPGDMERALAALVAPQPSPVEPARRRIRHTVLLALAGVAMAALVIWMSIPPPFAVEAQWFRSATGEKLLAGARLTEGDGVYVEIEPSRKAWVWVLNQDERGDPVVVFPMQGLDRRNPLPAGRRHRLPGTIRGEAWSWKVAPTGGAETFLVVASTTPLPGFERRIDALRQAGQPAPVPGDPSGSSSRGVVGIVRDTATLGKTGGLATIEAELRANPPEEVQTLKFQFNRSGS